MAGMCAANFSNSVVEDGGLTSADQVGAVAAHEVGHNLAMLHDDDDIFGTKG